MRLQLLGLKLSYRVGLILHLLCGHPESVAIGGKARIRLRSSANQSAYFLSGRLSGAHRVGVHRRYGLPTMLGVAPVHHPGIRTGRSGRLFFLRLFGCILVDDAAVTGARRHNSLRVSGGVKGDQDQSGIQD